MHKPNPEDKGLTAQEAVDCFCTYLTWAGTLSDDPEEREQAFGDAASELSAMLRHEIPDQPPHTIKPVTSQSDRVRRRAKKALKGQKKPGPKKRKQAVFKAMMTARQNPDQSLVPLWATGYKVGADRNASPELIATDMWFFKRCGRIKVDIETNAAAGDGLKYVGLRIYDAEPAQAVSGDAQDAVATVDEAKALYDQLQQTAELPEPAQDEDQPPDNEQGQLSRREERKQETQARRDRWYDMSQEIKADNKPRKSIELAKAVEKQERKAGYTKANAETIKRRLNKDHRGWADLNRAKENWARKPGKINLPS